MAYGEVIKIQNVKYIDLTPLMTTKNNPIPFEVTSNSYIENFEGYRCFDGIDNTKYRSDKQPNPIIQIKFDKKVKLTRYSLMLKDGSLMALSMNSWQFEGSNDAVNWNMLHSVTGKSSWVYNETYIYNFQNDNEYLYYRIYCTAKNAEQIQISKINFYSEVQAKIKQHLVSETNIPSSIEDGDVHIYYTEKGRTYISKKDGTMLLMNKESLNSEIIFNGEASLTGEYELINTINNYEWLIIYYGLKNDILCNSLIINVNNLNNINSNNLVNIIDPNDSTNYWEAKFHFINNKLIIDSTSVGTGWSEINGKIYKIEGIGF